MNMEENKTKLIYQACAHCGGRMILLAVKLIPTNNPNPYWPKYVPQIKEFCAQCNVYIRFAPQTMELINRFNELLEGVIVRDK